MPSPTTNRRDMRIEAKLQKRIEQALASLETDTAALADQWRDVPEASRDAVLAHSPTLARLVAFARRWC